MATEKSSAPHAHPPTRKPRTGRARTNLGRYRSLERRYWRGDLTLEEERRFEALVSTLWTLHKSAAY